jgi:hypothetical protein
VEGGGRGMLPVIAYRVRYGLHYFYQWRVKVKKNISSGGMLALPAFAAALSAALVLAGCATTVPINSVREPTIDTTGIQRLVIQPFENASGLRGPDAVQLTRYLSEQAEQRITAAGKFTIVGPADPNADGVFSGELRSVTHKDSQEQKQGKRNGQDAVWTEYTRTVSLEFSYSVISSRTGAPVGKVVKTGSTMSSAIDSPAELADVLSLAKSVVDTEIRGLQNDIVPHIVSVSRKLMNETSKDKIVKAKMKDALALVKNGNYAAALEQFDTIDREHGSAAARNNAGILREAIAANEAAAAELARLLEDSGGLAGKAVEQALGALNAYLPPGANISLMITRSTERDRIEYVVDQLTKAITREGRLTVVDRSNQALISNEQQFQMSGEVSDDSAAAVGRQLGVTYMVLCSIRGTGSLRRFNVRILNIETAAITSQTDYEI